MLLGGAAAVLVVLVLAAMFAWGRYRQELEAARDELSTLDVLLAEETERSLQSVTLVLSNVDEQLKGGQALTAERLAASATQRAVHDLLKAQVAGVPQADAVTVIGADGRLLNYSRGWPIPDVNVSDRDYFMASKSSPDQDWFLSRPVQNRGTGTWTIYLAHRLGPPGQAFVGLVLGAIELAHFQRLYASLKLDPGFFIALWRGDGTLLARYPIATIGQRVAPAAIQAPGGGDGVYQTRLALDGQQDGDMRLVSCLVPRYGLRVNVGQLKSSVLGTWMREMVYLGSATALTVTVLILLAGALIRRFHSYEAVAAALRGQALAQQGRTEAEEALRQAQKMEAIGQLTGGVAHDFNNLLTVIRSSVDLLRRPNVAEERRARNLDAIAEAVTRATRLTGQLLAFARRQTLQPEVFEVGPAVLAVTEMVGSLTGSRIVIETRLSAESCWTRADLSQFETALVNLAVNARDAMDGEGRIIIGVEGAKAIPARLPHTEQAGRYVAVSVADTGSGIRPDQITRIFEPFFTTKPVGKGTGLGLSQVFGFAKQSEGDVMVESEVGRGTTFTLYLTKVEAPTTQHEGEAADPARVMSA